MTEVERMQGARSRRKKAAHGIDAVRESVAQGVRENADQIAEGLVCKSVEGSVPAAMAAIEIAGQDKALREALERAVRPRRSLAIELANEPEWTGDDASGMAWWASKRPSVT